jgi:ubiquinone/menaquinone biosynthesis C-methylase UbiE
MYHAEEHHWWYVGLRAVLDLFWARHFESRPGGAPRVLDVGCGTGANLVWLSSKARAEGIDICPTAVRLCRERSQSGTAVASALNLPFPGASFDAAVSCDVLCHRSIPELTIPLREIHRVLKPGGLCFLSLPAYQWLRSSHDDHVQTARRFSKGEVVRLLKDCSFAPLSHSYWNTLLFPLAASVRLWRKAFPHPVSDLGNVPGERVSGLLGGVLAVERRLMRRVALPFGLSFVVVARKP